MRPEAAGQAATPRDSPPSGVPPTSDDRSVLAVRDLDVSVNTPEGRLQIISGVEFEIAEGEALGIVGESGCGKSTTARAIMGTLPIPPARIDRGAIRFDGRDLLRLSRTELNRLRGRSLTMIFQDPNTTLNPVFTIGDQLEAILLWQGRRSWHPFGVSRRRRTWATERAAEMLARVKLPDPRRVMESYPFQLSGGMRQRVLIAMALLNEPKLVVADEPGTALDVTIQDQILELFESLLVGTGLSLLYITHNLGIARRVTQRIVVMYAGTVVEVAPTAQIFEQPLHPYTQGLLACVPKLFGSMARGIEGRIPDLASMPAGCRFHPRCPYAMEICTRQAPPLIEVEPGRRVACHLYEGGVTAAAQVMQEARTSAGSREDALAGGV
jgi:oligopeptide/dipeptide ABC transporter ATP-binding protein